MHLNATEFNKILSEKGTYCIDMRNHYESEIDHFVGAITPAVDSFKESINFIDKKLENEKGIRKFCSIVLVEFDVKKLSLFKI